MIFIKVLIVGVMLKKYNKERSQGQNGNFVMENVFSHSPADCNASTSPVASQVPQSDAHGSAVDLIAAATTVLDAAAEEPQAAPAASSTLKVVPTVVAPLANSVSSQSGNKTIFNKLRLVSQVDIFVCQAFLLWRTPYLIHLDFQI